MAGAQGKVQFVKALIDTNIFLDVALQRQPFLVESDQVLSFVEDERLSGYISASAISDFYYIARRGIGRTESLDFLESLLSFCQVATVNQAAIDRAITLTKQSGFKDFEDAILNCTAVVNALDTIVTRNVKDFKLSELQIVTPAQLIERFG